LAGSGSRDAGSIPGNAVHLAMDGRYRGAFVLSGELRLETRRLLQDLGRRCEIVLLSGDNENERARFSDLFDDDSQLNFNQTPLDKLEFIRRRQNAGKTVMMVGDGLNDAGALRQSDVGVAVVESIGVFSPASDVILEGRQVPRLGQILTLARSAVWIVRWGLGFSALYNLLGIGIAAAGVLSPLICAVLMPLSSVSVVGFACAATAWTARRMGVNPAATPPVETELGQPELQPAG
jgi:Cu+-exporting ATPase